MMQKPINFIMFQNLTVAYACSLTDFETWKNLLVVASTPYYAPMNYCVVAQLSSQIADMVHKEYYICISDSTDIKLQEYSCIYTI